MSHPNADFSQAPSRLSRTRKQVAALCLRGGLGARKMLLITSRDTGRWVLPKGWPIDGLADHEAAAQEAWEEAGARCTTVASEPIGAYRYEKRLKDGKTTPVEAAVYLAEVAELARRYPEAKQRKRHWFSPREAARLVDEPTLRGLLRHLDIATFR
jgi:8-oxo-dGTP pyrophosphatase MutT (NUDIX family)